MPLKQKLILITNDDSIYANGIKSLVQMAQKIARVVVVAPDKPQSGMGHAITLNHPIRIQSVSMFDGVEAFSISGTPVDCVKLAIYEVLKDKPDLILSGINHGENSSSNVLYSGTMSAAIEGAMEGVPSIGISLSNYDSDANFNQYESWVSDIISKALTDGLPEHTCLNVNIPNVPGKDIKGLRVCHQAHAFWEDRFDKRLDQFGRPYFWLTGAFSEKSDDKGSDLYALTRGYISIVPTTFDLTNYAVINQLNTWNI